MNATDYRNSVIIAIIGVFTVGAIISSGIISSLVFFFLMGTVPGTSYTLTPETMLALWGTVAGIVVSGLAASAIRYAKDQFTAFSARKKRPHLPHRRYSRNVAQS